MAKKQGIDDISKAIMEAIKAARAGGMKVTPDAVTGLGKKAKTPSIEVSDGVTKTYPKKPVKDPIFGTQKVKIDSGDAYRTYDKGTPEYKAALKKKMANQKRLEKLNKKYDKSDGSKNRAYQEALEAEKQSKNWFMQSDGGVRNESIVRNYLDPKAEAKRAKAIAKNEKNPKMWMMPDGELMPKKQAKKALKKDRKK